jgi:hypothetical protein
MAKRKAAGTAEGTSAGASVSQDGGGGRGDGAPRGKVEVAPPVRPRCECGSEDLRFAYSTVFRDSGFRRVTANCQACGRICWWDEKLRKSEGERAWTEQS